MGQEELRELYKERVKREKQAYISQVTGIDASVLSKFKKGKIKAYPYFKQKLENYLLNS